MQISVKYQVSPKDKEPTCLEQRGLEPSDGSVLPKEVPDVWALQNYFPEHFASIISFYYNTRKKWQVSLWDAVIIYRLGLQGRPYRVCKFLPGRISCLLLKKCSMRLHDLQKIRQQLVTSSSQPVLLFSFFPTHPQYSSFLEHLIDMLIIFLKLPLSFMKVLRICPRGQ